MRGIFQRTTLIISLITLIVLLLIYCTNDRSIEEGQEQIANIGQKKFAGSGSCAGCHKDIFESYSNTAHFFTSRAATRDLIMGSFEKGRNIYAFSEKVYIAMEKRDSGYYQTAYQDGAETKHRKFDIVMGSGKKGQTYAYWMENKLFQLPISYFSSVDQWSNSPGFPDRIVFNRPITSRCLECHSTYAQVISAPNVEPEEYDHTSMIFGIDCEKCHGPAIEHVKYHQENPGDTVGSNLADPSLFTRQQKLDLCALCHGGRMNKTQASFTFKAGDKLSDYFFIDTIGRRLTDLDVHGNQFGMLSASKCFTMSQMTCESCHDPHKNETGQFEIFSARCMNCHDGDHDNTCKLTQRIGPAIKKNCIDCHMPDQPSKAITFLLEGDQLPTSAMMRTHLIKPYPELTEKLISEIKKMVQIKK